MTRRKKLIEEIETKLNAVVLFKLRTYKFGKYPIIVTGIGEYCEAMERAQEEDKKLVVVARFSDGLFVTDKNAVRCSRVVDEEQCVLLNLDCFKRFL